MTVLVLSILAFRDQEVYVDRYIQIITNWEKPPIEEVKFTYTNKNCEDAYGKQVPLESVMSSLKRYTNTLGLER